MIIDINTCTHCGAQQGEFHRDKCDVEPCPACGRQLVSCSCANKSPDDRILWSGSWPGVEECLEFGWYGREGPAGWIRCDSHKPGAEPDLNRLRSEARWDRSRGRFVRGYLRTSGAELDLDRLGFETVWDR